MYSIKKDNWKLRVW